MQAARDFFALPAAVKQRVDSALSPHVRGWSQLGAERTVGVTDVREVWEMGPDARALTEPGQPAFMRMQGPNLWPAAPRRFRPAVGWLFESMGGVCTELMQAVALGLGQPDDYFETAGYFADRDTAMKLKACSYPTALLTRA